MRIFDGRSVDGTHEVIMAVEGGNCVRHIVARTHHEADRASRGEHDRAAYIATSMAATWNNKEEHSVMPSRMTERCPQLIEKVWCQRICSSQLRDVYRAPRGITTSKTTRLQCTSPPTHIVLQSMQANVPRTTIEGNTTRRAGIP